MMTQLLADVAGGDPMVSGKVVIGIIGALCTGAAAIIGKVLGRKEGETTREVTLKKPVPTVQIREEQRFVGRDEYLERWERMDAETSRLWNQFGKEREIWNREIENIQTRLDTQSKATATMQGTVDEVNKTVGQLLSLALNRKPPGTRQ